MFFVIMVLFLSISASYLGWRYITPLKISPWRKRAYWGGLAMLVVALFVPFYLRRLGLHDDWALTINWVIYLELSILSMILGFTILRDLVWIFARRRFDPERRKLLIGSTNRGVLAASGIGALAGYGQVAAGASVKEVEIPINNLPSAFDQFTIVQITDIHIGPTVRRAFIEPIAKQVNELDPDLVALTGDLFDGDARALFSDVEPLGDIKAKYGKYFVTGNHEYYSGLERCLAVTSDIGYRNLINEHVVINREGQQLAIGGVTDFRTGSQRKGQASNPQRAFAGAPDGAPKILLAHQPRSVYAAAEAGVDLQLSGHTHAGQYFPWNLTIGLFQPFIKGLSRHENTWIYVNQGTGYWGPPNRLGVTAEITKIRLVKA